MPAHRYMEENSLAVMVATNGLTGVTPDMNLKVCMSPPSTNKATHAGFETKRRCHQKSKTGVSVAPQQGLMSCHLIFFSKIAKYMNHHL